MSQRILIIGVGESGKSGLARKMIAEAGLPYFVFDPLLSDWPDAELVTNDIEVFKDEVEAFDGPRIAVVDEALEALGVGDKQNHKIFYRWRHEAILPVAIAQRYKMIAPNVRVNATDVFIFETAKADCEVLAEDFNCPGMLEASEFGPGDYFHFQKRGPDGKKSLTRHRLW